MQNIRKEYLFLKDFYSKETQNWKKYFQTIENTFQKGIKLIFYFLKKVNFSEIQITTDKYSKQINAYRTEIEQYQQQLKYKKNHFFSNSSLHFSSETNQSLRDFQVKYQQSQFESRESHTKYENLLIKIIIYLFSRLKNDLESSRKGIEVHQNELSHLRQQLSQTEQNRIELQNEFEQTKHQCRQYERQISEKD
jgi:chromosome segregation ATPase